MVLSSRKLLLLLGMALLASMQVVSSMAEESPPTYDAPTYEEKTEEEIDAEGEVETEDPEEIEEPQDGIYDHLPPLRPIPSNIPDMTDLPPPNMPDMTNGGVLVYFHLYKTGGSSITELILETKGDIEEDLTEYDEENLVFENNREDLTGHQIVSSVALAMEKKIPVFYNFHVEFPATMYPTLVEAAPVLNGWREYAESQGVPFFLATVLREPLGHALSFFNFFHVVADGQDWTPFTGELEPTEENFLKTYVPNRLCHLMYDDAHGILEAPEFALREGVLEELDYFMDHDEINRRNEPSNCDIDVVRNILFGGTFDYVGVTERLSTHILPMFMKIMLGDPTLAIESERKKDVDEMFDDDEPPPLKKNKLSEATKEKVAKESAKDQQLYEESRDRFSHWPQFLSPEEAAGVNNEKSKNSKQKVKAFEKLTLILRQASVSLDWISFN